MKKQTNDASSPGEVYNSWDESPFIQWISQYGRYLFLAVIGFITLLLVVYRMISGGSGNAERDYLAADDAFALFARPAPADVDSAASKDALAQLQTLLNRYPELHAKYDGLIAQTLIYRGQQNEAAQFAALTLNRTADENSPFYTDYSQNTLLIGSKHYSDALARAQSLQQKMLDGVKQGQARAFGDTLFAFNLVRIGMLQQQLGLKKEELQTWQEWKGYLNHTSSPATLGLISSSAFQKQVEQFTENKISLLSYIEAREKLLKDS
jgi:hypothetical protein